MKYSEYRTRFLGSRNKDQPRQHEMSPTQKDMLFYTQGLISLECLCGREKLKGNALCRQCFKALPDEMQKALDDAVKWLQKNRW
jgi:hypothetical protein